MASTRDVIRTARELMDHLDCDCATAVKLMKMYSVDISEQYVAPARQVREITKSDFDKIRANPGHADEVLNRLIGDIMKAEEASE